MSGLRGCTILNTRSADQSGGLSAALQALGATVVEAPLIAFEDPSDPRALHEALGRLASYDWLLLTSANAVRRLAAGLRAAPPASPLPPIAAVGRATAAAAASELGAAPRVTARDSRGEGLAASLERRGPVAGLRMLLPRAEAAREALPEALRALGAVVDVVAVYRTVQRPLSPEARRLLREGRVDAVILTSGSTVEALVEDLGGIDLLRGTALAVIGPVTAEALRRRGLEPAVQAARAEASALAEALRAHFAGEGG